MTFDFFRSLGADAEVNTLVVDTLIDENDEDLGAGDFSLREAVSAANSSDIPSIITFAQDLQDGIIDLSLGELVLEESVLVDGNIAGDEQPDITIDAGLRSRIFNVQAPNVALNGLTLASGQAEGNGGSILSQAALDVANSVIRDSFALGGNGGGIAVSGANLQLTDTTLLSNVADSGGGLYVESGDTLVQRSAFRNNEAFPFGGGIFNSGTFTLIDSELDGNQADQAGGGLFNNGVARVESSVITNNFGRTAGGGLANRASDSGSSQLTVVDSVVSDNSADFTGGGIDNQDGELLVTGSAIVGNNVDFQGGGIFGSGEITNSSIADNASAEYGGGLFGQFTIANSSVTGNTSQLFGGGLQGSGTLSNTLVNGNRAEINGGGVLAQGGDLEITNSTISENTLGEDFFSGAGLGVDSSAILNNSIIAGSIGGDDVQVTEGSGRLTPNGVNLVADGSLVGDNIINDDPGLGAVSESGSVLIQPLLAGSPAIDAGDNNLVSVESDQRGPGFPRIQDGDGDGLATVDLGAVEADAASPPTNLFLSLKKTAVLGGKLFNDEDVIRYDGSSFIKIFDGSDLGLGPVQIDAFDILGDNSLLLSFNKEITLEGIGLVDDSDIVRFTSIAESEETEGIFELYLDGSDVGLDERGEDIDALTGLANGDLIVSTKGPISVPGVEANREDLLRFSPTSLGDDTSGTWSLYADTSDIGLGNTSVDALHIQDDGELLLSTSGRLENEGAAPIANDDVFGFSPLSLGDETSGTFGATPAFDGSEFGLLNNSIGSFSLG